MTLSPGNPDLSLWLWGRCPPWTEGADELPLLTPAQVRTLSPQALAYLGDAVYELFIRGCYLFPPRRIQLYHQQVVSQVRAEQQAQALAQLHPYLTPDEVAILKWGRNATPSGRRADAINYGQATGLETLVGYLYVTDPQRLSQLLGYLLREGTAPGP